MQRILLSTIILLIGASYIPCPINNQQTVAMHQETWHFRIRTANGGEVEVNYTGSSYDNCKYQLMRQYPKCTIIDSHQMH